MFPVRKLFDTSANQIRLHWKKERYFVREGGANLLRYALVLVARGAYER
jgi:hypothetical protein